MNITILKNAQFHLISIIKLLFYFFEYFNFLTIESVFIHIVNCKHQLS